VNDWLVTMTAWCGPRDAALGGMFLAGLAGSAMHCAPMCGGFVLGQVADGMARLPAGRLCESARIGQALLLPYHAGRLVTYSALGAIAGLLGSGLGLLGRLAPVSAALLFFAAALLAGHALLRLAPNGFAARLLPHAGAPRLSRLLRGGARRIGTARGGWQGGLMLGLLLGLLPCGLLYAVLAAAAASGSPARGALAMLVFGLGTIPSLVGVGLAGHVAAGRARGLVARLAPGVLLANAVLLVILATEQISNAT
jgi:uncharacterized protein